jgi:ABC-type oligopeptide transport system substrate-binding subunit
MRIKIFLIVALLLTSVTVWAQSPNFNNLTAEVNMKSKYRGEFNNGDQVQYRASKGQIKKSGMQALPEE